MSETTVKGCNNRRCAFFSDNADSNCRRVWVTVDHDGECANNSHSIYREYERLHPGELK